MKDILKLIPIIAFIALQAFVIYYYDISIDETKEQQIETKRGKE